MVKHKLRLILSGLALFCCSAYAETVINLNTSSDVNSPYAVEMIKLANQHIGNKYRINSIEDGATKSRIMEDVVNGKYDLFWASTNMDTEAKFDPVRIPLFKGLLGHRIFIIRQGDQTRFDQVKTLQDVQQIKMGSGTTWADTGILKANGMTIVTANKYPNMFYMLDGARFDAFPRGVFEPFVEVEQHSDLPLTVEKNLMLVYRMPFYLFARQGNRELVNDLTQGFEAAIKDGSFDKLFINAPTVQDVIKKANLKHRKIFYLDNPTLSKETPVDRPELWVDAKTLGDPIPAAEVTTN